MRKKILESIGAETGKKFLEEVLSDLMTDFPLVSLPSATALHPDLPKDYKVSAQIDLQIEDLSAVVTSDNELLILTGVGVIDLKSQELNLHLRADGEGTIRLLPDR